jgi:hypothetical protein
MSPLTRACGFSRRCLYVLTACASVWAQPAAAVFGSISYPLMAVDPGAGGTTVAAVSVTLPTTNPSFSINFVLPRDYKNNTPVKIVFNMLATETCEARVVATAMTRRRAGALQVSVLAGLSGGGQVAFSSGSVIAQKAFTLVAGGAPVGQLRGDTFWISFTRDAADPADTCGIIYLSAIDIRYEKAP